MKTYTSINCSKKSLYGRIAIAARMRLISAWARLARTISNAMIEGFATPYQSFVWTKVRKIKKLATIVLMIQQRVVENVLESLVRFPN